jgi:hypothetical protein
MRLVQKRCGSFLVAPCRNSALAQLIYLEFKDKIVC